MSAMVPRLRLWGADMSEGKITNTSRRRCVLQSQTNSRTLCFQPSAWVRISSLCVWLNLGWTEWQTDLITNFSRCFRLHSQPQVALRAVLILDIHHFSTLLEVSVLPPDRASPSGLQVDMACGEHLLDHCQSLKDIKKIAGKEAFQVSSTECFHTKGLFDHPVESWFFPSVCAAAGRTAGAALCPGPALRDMSGGSPKTPLGFKGEFVFSHWSFLTSLFIYGHSWKIEE